MKHNPFRKRTGILPSYFTGREDELNELKETYYSTKQGVQGQKTFSTRYKINLTQQYEYLNLI